MIVPMVNLKPALAATEPQWRERLDHLLCRAQFILGEQVSAFEQEFAAYHGARFAVGVGSGTDGLTLCLRAAGVSSQKQEVILPALTSPFTAQAVIAAGARPRFADVDEGSLLLDSAGASERVNSRTAALLPVHLYGQPCDLASLARLARLWRVPLIQDACQAHGAAFEGREPFTRYSPYVVYSFYPTKNLGCLGDGGAVLTSRAGVAHSLRSLRDGGRHGGQVSRVAATHSRLDEMQACYLRAFLPKLAAWNAHRARIARLYDEALAGCPGVRLLPRPPGSVHHLYVIRARRRQRLRDHLGRRGIATAVHYPVPLHLQPAFRASGQKAGDLPRAERACREILSLPAWPYMPEPMALSVAEEIRKFYL